MANYQQPSVQDEPDRKAAEVSATKELPLVKPSFKDLVERNKTDVKTYSIPKSKGAKDIVYLTVPEELEQYEIVPDDFSSPTTRLWYVNRKQKNGNYGYWGFTISIVKGGIEFRFPVEGILKPLALSDEPLERLKNGNYLIPGRGEMSPEELMRTTKQALIDKGHFGWWTENIVSATPKWKKVFNWKGYLTDNGPPNCSFAVTSNLHAIWLMLDSCIYAFKRCDDTVAHKQDGVNMCEWARANVEKMTPLGIKRTSHFAVDLITSWKKRSAKATLGVIQRYGWPLTCEAKKPEDRLTIFLSSVNKPGSTGLAAMSCWSEQANVKKAVKSKLKKAENRFAVLREDPLDWADDSDDSSKTAILNPKPTEEKVEDEVLEEKSQMHHQFERAVAEVPLVKVPEPKKLDRAKTKAKQVWARVSDSVGIVRDKIQANLPERVVEAKPQTAWKKSWASWRARTTKWWTKEVSFNPDFFWEEETIKSTTWTENLVGLVAVAPAVIVDHSLRAMGHVFDVCRKKKTWRERARHTAEVVLTPIKAVGAMVEAYAFIFTCWGYQAWGFLRRKAGGAANHQQL
ncbi:hypothetical protein QKP85_gp2 [Neurospora discreta fusarivirus 2]|uniref:Uncharacterized protein n=1 Tax=Neurospora discreta fusarivirus 2 TaxID=2776808 RepID=A0AAD1NH84_9VIRU|nr:hypothetical protein QKP85_gp2 [Neurospora discreta fusarivirus 2]BCL64195.1 hypothetical protein [Neurospora discreta fusarivirus 2]